MYGEDYVGPFQEIPRPTHGACSIPQHAESEQILTIAASNGPTPPDNSADNARQPATEVAITQFRARDKAV